jgi:hypothetical protein
MIHSAKQLVNERVTLALPYVKPGRSLAPEASYPVEKLMSAEFPEEKRTVAVKTGGTKVRKQTWYQTICQKYMLSVMNHILGSSLGL